MKYSRDDIREWAMQGFVGVHNVIIPSYTADLKSINEAAIRHDIRREIELGFSGCLLVAETAITNEEYTQFVEIAADEAKGRLTIIAHAAANTLEENVDVIKDAGTAGADLVLMTYPPSFYPQTERDIFNYTRDFCDGVDVGVILFPVSLWGFEHIHGASISVDVMEELVDACPNVVGVKAEGGNPSIAGFIHAWRRLSDRVVVTMPIVQEAIPLATVLPTQVMATSNTEYFGDAVPRMFQNAREGNHEIAMAELWKLTPAWRANGSVGAIPAAHSGHRMAWKYQAWLNGFNGGPLRMPTTRLHASQMSAFRNALKASGVKTCPESDDQFFIGRNPE